MDHSSCLIDGFGPVPVVQPSDLAELGDLVRRAGAGGSALYPLGGRTQLDFGVPPATPGQAVDMTAFGRVVDFPARDMTITVQAGIRVARLQQLVAAEKLRLPIDVPRADQATLGGILAANTSGPHRYGFGTLRDYVIGISAMGDDGNEFRAGGRVVKNVAGYDICKLLVGSLGTLGIITQATLKLRPLAEEQAVVTLACEDEGLAALLERLHASRTRPVCVDALNRAAAATIFAYAGLPIPIAPWTIVVGFEGNAEAVNWQVQQLVKEAPGGPSLEALIDYTARPLWGSLVEWQALAPAQVTFKANLLPSATAAFCRAVGDPARKTQVRAHAGNGIVVGHLPHDLTKEQAAAMLSSWRERAAKAQGRVVVLRCPSAWKDALSVWGPPGGDTWLMQAVKEKLDPRRLFNPGRFVGGI